MNIILTGMPGSGKSTVGVLLAKALGKSFIDTDLLIQSAAGMKLAEIIEKYGNDGFEERENAALLSVADTNAVVATGGSAVFCRSGMEHLRRNGIVVLLDVPTDELSKRLTGIKNRGVVMREGETIAQLAEERAPYYAKYADITVRESGDIESTVARVAEAVAAYGAV